MVVPHSMTNRSLPPGWHHLVMQYDGTRQEICRNGLCVARDVPGRPLRPGMHAVLDPLNDSHN